MIEMFKKVVFENYANFDGRARRREYWMFVLGYYVLIFVLAFVSAIVPIVGPLVLAVGVLGVIVPSIAVSVRRMHDVGKSGWYCLIPYYNLYLYCIDGEKGANQYGPDPKNQFEDINEIGNDKI
ncbi:DUF805 domain-containing protein [Flavobacterium hungaricum]|uniref:DUF805 domain-containing protein n=1 Tax=Flavobacterium hungaricum TaxID=2082725 RepID=UPI001883E3EC|nr:DUF805 domain-containing protein [Flavobacterium hungaricum]